MIKLYRPILVLSLLITSTLGMYRVSYGSENTLTLASFNIPPYLYQDNEDKVVGSLVDLLTEASQNSDIKIEYRLTNWSRAQEEVKNGSADLIFPVIHTKERESWLNYPSKPVTHFEMSLFSRKANPINFDGTPVSLHGLRIGKIDKGKIHPMFSDLEKTGKIDVVALRELGHLVKSVSIGRLDTFAAPKKMILWHIQQQGVTNIIPITPNIGVSAIYVAMSKNSPNQENLSKFIQHVGLLE